MDLDYEQAAAYIDEWLEGADHSFAVASGAEYVDVSPGQLQAELMRRASVVRGIVGAVCPPRKWRANDITQLRDAALEAQYLLHDKVRIDGIFSKPGPKLAGAELHPTVWDAARSYWRTNHRRQAVAAAARAVNALAQAKLGRHDVSDRA